MTHSLKKRSLTDRLEHKANIYKKQEQQKAKQAQQQKELKDFNDNKRSLYIMDTSKSMTTIKDIKTNKYWKHV